MMKKHILLGLMALCLAGGVGSAVAVITTNSANASYNGALDTMVQLTWGDTDLSAGDHNLGNISDLAIGVAQYKYIEALPVTSASAAGTVTVTFTLTQGEGANDVLTGLTVGVYDTGTTVPTNENKATWEIAGNLKETLNTGEPVVMSKALTFHVNGGSDDVSNYYALKVLYSGGVAQGKTLAGRVTAAMSFSAD